MKQCYHHIAVFAHRRFAIFKKKRLFCICKLRHVNDAMSKISIRFYNDRETFMKGIDYSYYYEQE